MPIKDTHPLYTSYLKLWMLCRDANNGNAAVKSKREAYLPPTAGMVLDGMRDNQIGRKRYDAYLKRAIFPEIFTDTVNTLVGIMNKRPPHIELPQSMLPLMGKATILGESLDDVIRKIHEQQIITGRVGLHLDVPSQEVREANMLPLLSIFDAESIPNWDDGQVLDPTMQTLNMVVLNVSEYQRSGFSWAFKEKYRVLSLGDFDDNEEAGTYYNGLFDADLEFNKADLVAPKLRGVELQEIPFVFIGPKDININPDLPPLLGLAYRSMAIYLLEADHRQALHLTSDETLVTIGQLLNGDDDIRVGTGSRIAMAEGGDVKYVGPESRALEFTARNIERDMREAKDLSSRLSQGGSQVESGEALRIRVAAQTANLASIASSAAGGLQEILRIAARWLGEDDEKVIVKPNLDFADDPLEFSEVNDMLTFKQRGGVISHTTINDIMRQRDLTSRTLQEEIDMIEQEGNLIPDNIADMFAVSTMAGNKNYPIGEDDDTEQEEDDDDQDQDQDNQNTDD